MKNQNQAKLFAFKLAAKKERESKAAPQWKLRDGVAVAGCTGRLSRDGRAGSTDSGTWC